MQERKNTHTRLIAKELARRWRALDDGLETASGNAAIWLQIPGASAPILMNKLLTSTTAKMMGATAWCLLFESDTLSPREYQIFVELAAGRSPSEIAAKLFLSIKTISTYRSRILEKLGLFGNAEMTIYAYRNGLVAWPERLPGEDVLARIAGRASPAVSGAPVEVEEVSA